ncbi:transcriptional regulator [Halorubrum californiense DSM 19288]|uniref:Transcriptional regulator n=1 Tax=Halorubrum californiense DSM 19288 TaxID=1227465 RepID=M0E7Q4_9EURY|nr:MULTISPECIES: CBS domain-containing protein [Halorubrum]ELZ42947.1 transcriptional regulator [Halorubrum californiense DSM 19288]TKX68819.1 CBS domain-containing protein [Halorubrum sp. GN11GM_10-3_MGM]
MPRDLYDCTAAELATHSVERLDHDTAPSTAAAWLADNGYDAAPVYADDDPVGFIHKDDVTTDDDGTTLADHLTPLTIDYMVSGDTSFTALLSALIDNPVYFLGGPDQVTGILTRADLNTAPARIYLFDRITYLEEHLRELVLDVKPDWKTTPVTRDELDGIEARHEDAQAANVALDELHYAQFSTLQTIVTNVETCWEACGFTTKGTADSRLHDVTDLRNDVAHANLLVETTDNTDFLASGRTTENLYRTLETIDDVLSNLQAAGYDPGAPEPQDDPDQTGSDAPAQQQ